MVNDPPIVNDFGRLLGLFWVLHPQSTPSQAGWESEQLADKLEDAKEQFVTGNGAQLPSSLIRGASVTRGNCSLALATRAAHIDGEDGNHTREFEHGKCSPASLIVLWKHPQQVAWILELSQDAFSSENEQMLLITVRCA